MHSGLHTSVGRRIGGMGRESAFSQRETPTLLPDYGTWMECMGTLGILRSYTKKQAVSSKEKADVAT